MNKYLPRQAGLVVRRTKARCVLTLRTYVAEEHWQHERTAQVGGEQRTSSAVRLFAVRTKVT